MFNTIDEGNGELYDLLFQAVGKIHETQDFPSLLAWVEKAWPEVESAVSGASEDAPSPRAVPISLARAIWNATPLASQGYLPQPLPTPGRNSPCYCGSGRKYKQCCKRMPNTPFPVIAVWSLLLEHMDDDELREAWRLRKLPKEVLLSQVTEDLEEGDVESALQLLEVYFSAPPRKVDAIEADYVVTTLCDAYDNMGEYEAKVELLETIKHHPSATLRCAAWQRLATVYMDAGDPDAAWRALEKARKLGPDDVNIGLLELILLLSEKKFDQARQRASAILPRLQRGGRANEEALAVIRQIQTDPEQAYHLMLDQARGPEEDFEEGFGTSSIRSTSEDGDVAGDVFVSRLDEWVVQALSRPLPDHRLTPVTGRQEADDPQGLLFTAEGDPTIPCYIEPPDAIARLEKKWRSITHPQWRGPLPPGIPADTFGRILKLPEQLDFIGTYPETADSFAIVADMMFLLREQIDGQGDAERHTTGKIATMMTDRLLGILDRFDPATAIPASHPHNAPLYEALTHCLAILEKIAPGTPSIPPLRQRLAALDPNRPASR